MSERLKRILVVAGFVLSVFAIAGALYYFFFRPAPPPPSVMEPDGTETGGLPGAGTGGPPVTVPPGAGGAPSLPPAASVAGGGLTVTTPLTTGDVTDVTLAADGTSANFYNPNDGKFYTVNADGDLTLLSDEEFPDVETVEWNGDGDKAVLEFPDGSNIVYDFATEQQVTLPQHWEDFTFSPTTDEIEAKALGVDPNNRWLVTVNADGSNVKAFQALGENADKVTVAWSPNDQVVAFSDTASELSGGLDRKLILPLGTNDENYRGLTVEGLGFLPVWAPDGKRLLYSVSGDYSSNKPLLWIVDATPATMGENRRSLSLNTWADKCTFADATTAYCAVPRSLPANAGIQRPLFVAYPDSVYKIDVATGRVSLIAIPEEDVTMENLRVSEDGATLYFISRDEGNLQSIRLK